MKKGVRRGDRGGFGEGGDRTGGRDASRVVSAQGRDGEAEEREVERSEHR